jgi:single-stranded-DNA-specific exonuclease
VRLAASNAIFDAPPSKPQRTTFQYQQRQYTCGIYQNNCVWELRIKNPEGKILVVQSGNAIGLLGTNREQAVEVDVSQPQYNAIIQAALQALSCYEREQGTGNREQA